jgi:hypothetical protein
MKKRWPLRLGLLAGLALFGFWFVLWLTAPVHRITEWHITQIKKGMTLKEVKSILRAFPGEYLSKPLSKHEAAKIRLINATFAAEMRIALSAEKREVIFNSERGEERLQRWLTDRIGLIVWFDANEEVLDLRWMSLDDDSVIGKIRRFLRLP